MKVMKIIEDNSSTLENFIPRMSKDNIDEMKSRFVMFSISQLLALVQTG